MTAHDKLELASIWVGAVSFMLAGMRWRNLHYSVGAFFAAPAAAIAAFEQEWDVAAIMWATALLTIMIDVYRWKRDTKKA